MHPIVIREISETLLNIKNKMYNLNTQGQLKSKYRYPFDLIMSNYGGTYFERNC